MNCGRLSIPPIGTPGFKPGWAPLEKELITQIGKGRIDQPGEPSFTNPLLLGIRDFSFWDKKLFLTV